MKTKKRSDLFAEERKNRILELVRTRKKVTVPELVRLFGVTGATVRTHLRELDRANLLTRTHGGAIERTKTGFELKSVQKEVQNLAQKRRIAECAVTMIEDGDTIVLDTGTTTLELAKLLDCKKDITVVTNDIEIARTLEDMDRIKILLMGGLLRKGFHCTFGLPGKEMTAGLTVDKAFMATNSLSLESGAATPDIHQAETKKAMISMSRKIILLCDGSKIGKVSFAQFAALSQIDVIVTDAMDEKDRRSFEAKGVEIRLAPA